MRLKQIAWVFNLHFVILRTPLNVTSLAPTSLGNFETSAMDFIPLSVCSSALVHLQLLSQRTFRNLLDLPIFHRTQRRILRLLLANHGKTNHP